MLSLLKDTRFKPAKESGSAYANGAADLSRPVVAFSTHCYRHILYPVIILKYTLTYLFLLVNPQIVLIDAYFGTATVGGGVNSKP